MYCTKCGVVLQESDAYCSQCGTPTGHQSTMWTNRPAPRLTRSIYDVKIAGVCGGLAQYLTVDPTLVRLIWLVATVCFPPLLLGYIAAWIIMPKEPPALPSPIESGSPQPQS
jgi:phage shock protein PspC (stress-responsive transcriptional regulator)